MLQGGVELPRFAFDVNRSLKVVIVLVLLLFVSNIAHGGGSPRAVLLVENTCSSVSREISNYYASARGIPASNRCRIRCSTNELVSRNECEKNIVAPIRQFIQDRDLVDEIDYIVLTKGVPLAADYGFATGALSIASVLTCIDDPGVSSYIENPYGPLSWNPVEVAFSHKLNLCGRSIYLVTRLDGYTVEDVCALIDRSVNCDAAIGPVMLDLKYLGSNPTGSSAALNERLRNANNILLQRNIPTIFDDTATFLSGGSGLMGYFSWGSNDPSYTRAAYNSNMFAAGAIADSYVSNSGRTFNPTSGGQSLVADLISQGASGVCGYVSEPYVAYATYPDILFNRYTKGYNLAESFYAACPLLYWKSVVIGDPLLAPYATQPEISVVLPSDPLTGVTQLTADVSDPKGVARVDFYINGAEVGSSSSEPYTVTVDTSQYHVGIHTIAARAVQAGAVASEGWAATEVGIVNPVSPLRVVADAFGCEDQQGIICSDVVVTTSTEDMGSAEFYVQELNGSSGVRVIWTGQVSEGDVVSIEGMLVTQNGERSILADSVIIENQLLTPPGPRGMVNKSVGGGDFCPNTPGVTGGAGLRNLGLLIKSWGRVTYVGDETEDFFYIDDGSRLDDESGHVGLRVKSRHLMKPAVGRYVAVTGISSCQAVGSRIIPVIKVRRQGDIKD